ncbi:MAG TPA: phage major capsid protein [Anaeromyxobacteraceae bacterium]|nr:phage major capsid protein [Anaeromyxobacteraceae bacterium]
MSFPNITDIVATTIESRSGEIADNVTKNNALFSRLKQKGRIRTFSGGSVIFEEISFAENQNFSWYSGYDQLAVSAQDVISGASFAIKQAAVPVVISGLEKLQNSGKEKIIDLLEKRISVAEATMANRMSEAVYSDGTGYGGKQMVGLASAVPVDPTTGTYGGIDRAVWSFWRSQLQSAGSMTPATIQYQMNALWSKCVRGRDMPDLIIFDSNLWQLYMTSLQAIQRFTSADSANLGFPTVKFMNADVVLDGGIGGYAPANSGWFLNTNYMFLRPHADRNMVPLSPGRRVAVNQDAEVEILAFAGNITSDGAQFQGFLKGY